MRLLSSVSVFPLSFSWLEKTEELIISVFETKHFVVTGLSLSKWEDTWWIKNLLHLSVSEHLLVRRTGGTVTPVLLIASHEIERVFKTTRTKIKISFGASRIIQELNIKKLIWFLIMSDLLNELSIVQKWHFTFLVISFSALIANETIFNLRHT